MSSATESELLHLEKVHQLINDFPYRTRTRDGGPGGLVEFPDSVVPLIVGDLHSSLVNLKRILDHDGNLKAIAKGERTLVFIGDTVHNDVTGMMREMDSSVAILEFIFELMEQNPTGVVYIRGSWLVSAGNRLFINASLISRSCNAQDLYHSDGCVFVLSVYSCRGQCAIC